MEKKLIEPLFDRYQRRLLYLRFSLTEACNMACSYCLPKGFPEWYRHKARLGLSDIETILRGFTLLGFRKVRFTGGEPTLHTDCKKAILIARDLGYETIALTSNGLMLRDLDSWIRAGLTSLNISLDSLKLETFREITKSAELEKVLSVIKMALDARIDLKINTVLMRNVNGHDLEDLIDWALERPLTLRFIELMPTGLNSSFAPIERMTGDEIYPLLKLRGLTPISDSFQNTPSADGPAKNWHHPVLPGKIGFINPLSCNFCAACNRLRVTARGALKLCLFGDKNYPLDLSSADALAAQVTKIIAEKPEKHLLETGNFGNVATFRTIGG